jgi:hypothetical protein
MERLYPQQYSSQLRKVLKAISIGIPRVIGSSANHTIMYSADYDLMERVVYSSKAVKTFQRKIAQMHKVGKIVDIKCGEVSEWNLLKRPYIKNGIVRDYDYEKELDHLRQLWRARIISQDEFNKGSKHLKENFTAAEYLMAKKSLRFGVLRWTPHEIAQGHKLFRNKTIYLDYALKSKGITKIDLVAWVNTKYVEVSNIIFWIKSSGTNYAYVPAVKKALAEDILFYEAEGNYMKVAKRILSLAYQYHDGETVNILTDILNSPLGKLYITATHLEILEEFPQAIQSAKKRKELDYMRDDFAKLFFPEFKGAVPKIELLPKMHEVLQREMEITLRKEGLLPIPLKYRI